MSDKPEQTETPSVEEQVAGFEKMPESKEFDVLDTVVKKGLLERFGASEETEPEIQDSETSKPDSEEGEETSPDDKKKSENPDDDDNEDDPEDGKSKKTEPEDNSDKQEDKGDKESSKELQAEFTRRSQRLKKVESENLDLRERLAKVEGLLEGKSDQQTDQVEKPDLSPLKALVEKNPKLQPLLDAIDATLDMKVESVNKSVKDRLEKQDRKETDKVELTNLDSFRDNLNEFLEGPLGELETELNTIIADNFSDVDTMEDAAKTDSGLWERLKGKLYTDHLTKVSQLLADKKDKADESEAKKRNREVKDTGVSRKSKTTTDTSDPMNMKNFSKLKTKEKRALLKQHGRVEDE